MILRHACRAKAVRGDEFALVAAASSLIRSKDGSFEKWMEISEQGLQLGASQVLLWVLDALSDADLHPEERKRLRLPQAFRELELERLSNDELCVAWRAFDRLQLFDRPTLSRFLRSTTGPMLSTRCGEVSPRYQSFNLWHWVVQAHGLRNMRHYPASSAIAKTIVRRLMVEEEAALRAQGLSFSALQALVHMVPLSSRQRHRVTAQLAALPLSPPQVAAVPRLAARGSLGDEDFFEGFQRSLEEALPSFSKRQVLMAFKGLLQWRVGAPGLDRSAWAALELSWEALKADTALRVVQALGRVESVSLGRKPEEDEAALLRALRGILVAMKTESFTGKELLLAMNALGQIARAWDWLEGEEMRSAAQRLGEAVRLEILLSDAEALQGKVSGYSTRDLALMLLAQGRIARRTGSLKDFMPLNELLAKRLTLAAEHCLGKDSEQVRAEATSSIAASSLMLMQCAKEAELHSGYEEALAAILTWCKAACRLGIHVSPEVYKALAAVTAVAVKLGDRSEPVMEPLEWLLQFATGFKGDGKADLKRMENWHLDSCLHALAVLDTCKRFNLEEMEVAVLQQVKEKLPRLRKSNVIFWQGLWDLKSELPEKLAAVLANEPLKFSLQAPVRDFLQLEKGRKGSKRVEKGARSAQRAPR